MNADTVRSLIRTGEPSAAERAVSRWWTTRRFHADAFGVERLLELKHGRGATVIIPVRECADTIAAVLDRTLAPALDAGLVDELVVVDAGSRDETARVAAAHGARVIQQDAVLAELGPALGKGDAMWRALAVTDGEIVCFLDGDTLDPAPSHLLGLLGPLLADPSLGFVKGAFERPFDTGQERLAHEGGRVTELMARPLINLHAPLLAGFAQPLAGEFAARRELLEQIPFPVGYGVEIATLLDALAVCGLDGLAECNLGTRQNRHQSLRALGEMAYEVLAAFELRLDPTRGRPPARGRFVRPWEGQAPVELPVLERPPLREHDAVRCAASGGS
ncbi:MAG TPA: glucosyl-3-phosphoglycerate synthase [Solirubrobacteraceae bacterium]